MMQKKLLVVTDLDSSLLNEDYSFMEAWGVLRRLKLLGCPVIFNSSKTLPEMEVLAMEMGLTLPMVAENGGVLCFPKGSVWDDAEGREQGSFRVKFPGLDRKKIVELAHNLRDRRGYRFSGYADWSTTDVAEHTGLDEYSAGLSLQRVATEPIIWDDSEEAWQSFNKELEAEGVRALRGGRFIHLMGSADKADGLHSMRRVMESVEPQTMWLTVALGDSENDLAMLEAADIAVPIPRADGVRLEPNAARVLRPNQQASAGWAEAMELLLEEDLIETK